MKLGVVILAIGDDKAFSVVKQEETRSRIAGFDPQQASLKHV